MCRVRLHFFAPDIHRQYAYRRLYDLKELEEKNELERLLKD